jgi:alpha-beta hydrolase superfamily lysophospholipase
VWGSQQLPIEQELSGGGVLQGFGTEGLIVHVASGPPLSEVLVGSQAETLAQNEAAYAKANEPKELFLIDGGKHFDFYDQPAYVEPAVAEIDTFLRAYL